MDLTDAYDLAEQLIDSHAPDGWRVEFDGAKRRAGVCRFHERVIGLSGPLTRLHDEGRVRDTILHEIAHARVGAEHGHDQVWRSEARRLGCSGERCVPIDAPRVTGAWLGVCAAGHTLDRHRRPTRVLSCSKCSAVFDPVHVFEWTHHGRPAPMHPNYLADLVAYQDKRSLVRLAAGDFGEVIAPGPFYGQVGVVLQRRRTKYHLQLDGEVIEVLFAGVVRWSRVPG